MTSVYVLLTSTQPRNLLSIVFPKTIKDVSASSKRLAVEPSRTLTHTLDSRRLDQPEQDLPKRVNPIYHPQLATKRVHLATTNRTQSLQQMSTPTATPTSTTLLVTSVRNPSRAPMRTLRALPLTLRFRI
ncbi:hypothetical protein KEM48_004449 [Puccinia striiformis f. sp. tritici PST-130]|nr:hypothetical protein KEM48_004449 [Puccinia striiformis f. sp. tritici PST-130]